MLTVESHLSNTQCIELLKSLKNFSHCEINRIVGGSTVQCNQLKSMINFSTIEINKIAGGSTVQCNSLSLLENFSLGRSMG